MGFDVLTARNLAEAYPFTRRTRPDIIVTEVAGRAVQGWDLLTTLKGDALMGDTAVVVVTSDARASTRERAMRDGCAAFYTKPCPPDVMAAGLWGLVAAQRV